MSVILWSILALVAVVGVLYVAIWRAQSVLPPIVLAAGETMPVTALERLARWTLVFVLVPTLAAAAIVAYHGTQVVWVNDHARLTATGLILAGLGVYTVYIARVGVWLKREDGTLDERDRNILVSASAGQAPAMMVTIAAWMIYLTERFHGLGAVPSPYLYLIFWTCLMVSVLASLAGVLIGYRRS